MSGRREKTIETGHVADVLDASVGINNGTANYSGRRIQLERANGFPDPIRIRDRQHGVEKNVDVSAFDDLVSEHEREQSSLVP